MIFLRGKSSQEIAFVLVCILFMLIIAAAIDWIRKKSARTSETLIISEFQPDGSSIDHENE